jgi:hypothetical protein
MNVSIFTEQKVRNYFRAREIRRISIGAVYATIVLNGMDVVSTHFLLQHGGTELNPLSALMLQDNILLPVKLGMLLAFGVSVIYHRGRLSVMAVTCGLAGLYATAVLSNVLLLREVM